MYQKFLFPLLIGLVASVGFASERGIVSEVIAIDGYDDNDVVLMAAVVRPPTGQQFVKMHVGRHPSRREILLTPVYKRIEGNPKDAQAMTVVFEGGPFEAGSYEVLVGENAMAEIRIARAAAPTVDDYRYPEVQDFEITKSENGAEYVISIKCRTAANERLKEIRILKGTGQVVFLPLMEVIASDTPSTAPATRKAVFSTPLPRNIPSGKIAVLVKGRKDENKRITDLLKIIQLE